MLFIYHFFKWCFAALLALVVTLFFGGLLVRVSMSFIDPHPLDQNVKHAVDASNLRQIGQASRIYSSDNHGRLPDAIDLPDYARLLAIDSGLNDPSIWIASTESVTVPSDFKTILVTAADGTLALDPRFASLPPRFTIVLGGLKAGDPPTTPVVWTRGLDLETGRWLRDSPYGGVGGHILFLSGNVAFYRTLQNATGGELIARDGRPTHRIRDALPLGARLPSGLGAPPPEPTFADRLSERFHPVSASLRVAIPWAWLLWMLSLFLKLTLDIARRWAVPVGRLSIESREHWLILAPLILLVLSLVFQT